MREETDTRPRVVLNACHPTGGPAGGDEVGAGDAGVGVVEREVLGAAGVGAFDGRPDGRADGTDEPATVVCRVALMPAPQAVTTAKHARAPIAVRAPGTRLTGQGFEIDDRSCGTARLLGVEGPANTALAYLCLPARREPSSTTCP